MTATPLGADVDARAADIFQGEITDWPARAARALQQYGDERDAEIARLTELVASVTTRANIEIARLRAPPGADVLELAIDFLWPCYLDDKLPKMDFAARDPQCQKLARALQQHGDARAAEAREAAIEEAAQIAAGCSSWAEGKITGDDVGQWGTYSNACDDCADMIRALAAKPGSAG